MTKKEIISIFLEKTLIPFVYIIACSIIFLPLAKGGGSIDLGILFVCTSYVFGVIAIRRKLQIDISTPIKTRLISIPIELIAGLIIGIAAYIYAIAVALYYIPITIYSLNKEKNTICETQSTKVLNKVDLENETPVLIDFESSFLDEHQIKIMREMQRAKELSTKVNKR